MKIERRIIIPASAKLIDAPTKIRLYRKHYEVLIGIGNDYTASLIIEEDALKALKAGAKINFSIDSQEKESE